jgi:uncharacterized protein YgiM (DUF1202 family)
MTKKTKIIAGIVTAILLLGGGVVYAINRKKKDPNAPVKRKPAIITILPLENLGLGNPKYVYTKSSSNLRKNPSTSSGIVKTYPQGVKMNVTSSGTFSNYDWWEVNDGQGNSGWMREDVVTISETQVEQQDLYY